MTTYVNVPYIHLERILDDGSTILFESSRETSEEFDFQDVFGINKMNIKLSQAGFYATFDIPIAQQMVQNPALRGVLSRITSFNGKWKCTFGWRGPERNSLKTFEANLSNSKIEFDAQLPGFNLTIELQSIYRNALYNIPIGFCSKTREFVRNGLNNNQLPISKILELLFDDCRAAVSDHQQAINQSQETISSYLTAPPDNYVVDTLYRLNKENIFYGLTEDDIPRVKDMVFTILLNENQTSENAVKEILLNANMVKTSTAEAIIRPENWDSLNVWHYMAGLLNDNDFIVYPTPWSDRGAKIGAFMNSSLTQGVVREVEFDGTFSPREGQRKFISTFRTELDVLDPNSGIISVSISTDSGENSIGTAKAIQNLINSNSSTANENAMLEAGKAKTGSYAENKAAEEFQNSLHNTWLRQSKSLSLEIYGNNDIFIWDNLNINLLDDLFSGVYKINEVEYNIEEGSYTTSIEAFQLIEGRRALDKLSNAKPSDYTYYEPNTVPTRTETDNQRVERKTRQGKTLNWTDFGKF